MWPASCSSSCFSSTSRKRTAPDKDVMASSRILGNAASRWHLPVRTVMPRSSSRPRIWLTTAVRRMIQRSRTRCRDCMSSCSSLLIGTKRIEGRLTASAIASASMKSFLLVFTNGFTYCAGIRRTSCPCSRRALAQEMRACAGFHSNQVNLHVGREAKKLGTRELFPHPHFSCMVETYEVKDGLAKINTDAVQFHGKSPSSSLYPSLGQRQRTIPLVTGAFKGKSNARSPEQWHNR